jgi:hypothetical protein
MICDTGLLLERIRNTSRSSFCSQSCACSEPALAESAAYWQEELWNHRANCRICSVVTRVPELSACPTLELIIHWRDRTQRVVEFFFMEMQDATLHTLDDARAKQALQMLLFWERQMTRHVNTCDGCGTRSAP